MKRKVVATLIVTAFTFSGATSAFASALTVDATPYKGTTAQSAQSSLGSNPEYIPGVIELTVYADPGEPGIGSSGGGLDALYGNHAWITIANGTTSNITVGKLSGIGPNKTVTIGTWGNKTEHTGLWYNLESYMVGNGAYSTRVSLTTEITSGQLSSLNTLIANSDAWSKTNNCSSFAEKAWNSVSSSKISAGLIDTPKNLADSIKSYNWYSSGRIVPWDYMIYYAQGTGAPLKSTVFN